MKKRILVNFLYEEDIKLIHCDYLILIPLLIVILLIGLNGSLKSKTIKLEAYIEENYKYTTVSNLDYNVDEKLIPISNIIEITKLINDKNIKHIKISNNKLSLLGYSYDSGSIKSYVNILDKNNKTNNASIESINREGDTYSFEIEANVGSVNEI